MNATHPEFPQVFESGGQKVKLYRCHPTNGRAERFAVADYANGKRKLRYFQSIDDARAEARRICALLAANDAAGAALTGKDRAELVRSREVVSRHGVSVVTACEIFAEAADIVGVNGIIPALIPRRKRKVKRHSSQ